MNYSSAYFNTPAVAMLLSQLHHLCFSASWDEKAFSDLLSLTGTTAQIISFGETPCGFSLYQMVGEDAEILTFGVLPTMRGRALGQLMLSEGTLFLKKSGVTRLFLEVSETNIPALKLYANSGFTQIGLRKNYYKEGPNRSHAIVMEKKLT